MKRAVFAVVMSAMMLAPGAQAWAQTPDPSGHWAGVLEAQGQQFAFDIDVAKNATGEFTGAVTIPVQGIMGLPLHVSVDGKSVQFYARRDQIFRGELSADGKSIAGEFSAETTTLTYRLTRTGDARLVGPATSPAVTSSLVGVWTGVVEPGGRSASVTLTIANHADGTSTGLLVNDSQGGLELPLTISQAASKVAMNVTVLDASFVGELGPAGDLTGTWKEGERTIPVTFTRAR
jgi:hypothetical protein